ncbi:ada2a-containing complex component 1 isoform X2 [Oratosquilla oratoria]
MFASLAPPGEECGEYFFESDPLALKGNHDYQQLIRALVVLESQRAQGVKDLERLQEAREEALKDPIQFVTALQNGQNLRLPGPQDITQIPQIDWEKYNVQSITCGMRPKTRKRVMKEAAEKSQESTADDGQDSNDSRVMVRGRPYDETKPQTFNQAWSEEEQRKLEELLMKYPDEPISSRRWAKISRDLGTRTPLQVQSRVQKYFIALKRKGLPVPGRAPSNTLVRRSNSKKKHAIVHASHFQRSHFMSAFNYSGLDEEADVDKPSAHSTMKRDADVSDEEDIAEELWNSEEYQELIHLKRIRNLKETEGELGVVKHFDFMCDVCGKSPIEGTRWHCMECPPSTSIDLCDQCVKMNFSTTTHSPTHILKPYSYMSIKDSINNPD